jgi:hypothetical protein
MRYTIRYGYIADLIRWMSNIRHPEIAANNDCYYTTSNLPVPVNQDDPSGNGLSGT